LQSGVVTLDAIIEPIDVVVTETEVFWTYLLWQ
jgi:hypothetical protein